MNNKEKITIIGAGYVGLANALAFSKYKQVKIYDINTEKIQKIKSKISPIKDELMDEYLELYGDNIDATNDELYAYSSNGIYIIATPTNYNEGTRFFDTSSIEYSLKLIDAKTKEEKESIIVVIKSTIPIGFVEAVKNKYDIKIIFSPEFLREGAALHDIINPSRIVIGDKSKAGYEVAKLYQEISNSGELMMVGATEAESIKLFANTYLAMRVAYINEIDNYCLENKLDSKEIIQGISADPRIGKGYNNPSFGYGGYCLPKDTKQLLANYANIEQRLISAIVESNQVRAEFIAKKIIASKAKVVGVYRLSMKKDSDNFRSSSIFNVIEILKSENKKIIIHEPMIADNKHMGFDVVNDIHKFKNESDIILANRGDDELGDVNYKLFTRDLFGVS